MGLVRTLLVIRYALYSAMLICGGIWFVTSTELGQIVVKRGANFTRVLADQAPDAARRFAEDERFRDYVQQAQQAATITESNLGVFADQASAAAYAAAATLPEPEELAAALEGWQTDLLDYEAQLRAELGSDATQGEIERRMDELFRPQTFAGRIEIPVERPAPEPPAAQPEEPAPAAPPAPQPEAPAPTATPAPEPAPPVAPAAVATRSIGFAPHPVFYRCPVIEVSNAGPTTDDRMLINYTPWVDTPAGVLIRAPVAGACLSSGYGPRNVNGASKNHGGVDYYNREGGAIYAAGDGVVTFAGTDEAYGTSVLIDHGNGVEGHYAHMVPGSLKVSQGQRVTLGDEIGVMGRSGRAYAVHLHYELRFAGMTVDPLYEGERASF